MRIQYNSRQQELGQFFTPPGIADLLARLLPSGGQKLLEIGAGEGALLTAAMERIGEVRVTAVERDPRLIKILRKNRFADRLITGDACSVAIHRQLEVDGPYDYVIGNPPYVIAEKPGPSLKIASDLGLLVPNHGARLASLFLAHSISLMSENASGAFIVPLTLFSDPAYATFRENLTKRFSAITVIELPQKVFEAAEVATVVCSFSGVEGARKRIKVGRADMHGQLEKMIQIGVREARQRMDYSFHEERAKLNALVGKDPQTLASIGALIARGSASSTEFQRAGNSYLHTSHLPVNGIGRLSYPSKKTEKYQLAISGDIVIPRVGTRCLLRQGLVEKGAVPFTDCIYRIRVAAKHQQRVLDSLAGPIGESWRKLYARGACAKHITSGDLTGMPIL